MEAPGLGPVFSPVARFLNSPEPGPREPTGATLLGSGPTFMEASVSQLVLRTPHPLPCLELPTCQLWWARQRRGSMT